MKTNPRFASMSRVLMTTVVALGGLATACTAAANVPITPAKACMKIVRPLLDEIKKMENDKVFTQEEKNTIGHNYVSFQSDLMRVKNDSDCNTVRAALEGEVADIKEAIRTHPPTPAADHSKYKKLKKRLSKP